MKKTFEKLTSKLSASTGTLAINAILLACGAVNAIGQSNGGVIDLCAKFINPSDPAAVAIMWNDTKGKYCDSQADVLCGSAGEGFTLLTTEASKSTRKSWINMKSAAQVDGTAVDVSTLSRGEVELTLWHLQPNSADGFCFEDENLLQNPLQMAVGQTFYYGAPIEFTDASKTASQGRYRLVFGQPVCGLTHTDSPLKVTAESDLDGDALADLWTIEPSGYEARAVLEKLNKRQQWDFVGVFSVQFQLVLIREEFGASLDEIN